MPLERRIWCFGASKWIQVIVCIYITWCTILLIRAVDLFAASLDELTTDVYSYESDAVYIVVTVGFYIFGIIMAIILLIGSIQKRVSCLIVWLIYEVLMGAIIAVFFVPDFIAIRDDMINFLTITLIIVKCIALIAFGIFSFVVVFIHIKEIKEGVFDLPAAV